MYLFVNDNCSGCGIISYSDTRSANPIGHSKTRPYAPPAAGAPTSGRTSSPARCLAFSHEAPQP